MTHLGYSREAGDKLMLPPLGGKPWNELFVENLMALNSQATHVHRIEGAAQSRYGTRHLAADDRFHMVTSLVMAWNTATQYGRNATGTGMFEVRLLSAVLVAARSVPLALFAEEKGEPPIRSSAAFLNDLQTAAQVLALYTGTDAGEIAGAAGRGQAGLMQYLKKHEPMGAL